MDMRNNVALTIYVVDQKVHNINNIIILIIYNKENLTYAFFGLLHKFKYNLLLIQIYGTLILLIPNRQNYFICTGKKKYTIKYILTVHLWSTT
jgi:hypothetical protein